MLKIEAVVPFSAADIADIKKNDLIISINNHEINDYIDLLYYSDHENLNIKLKRNNQIKKINIKNQELLPLGITPQKVKIKRCTNKCIFCFVDQMPKGFRKTLYIKDEDYRFSFTDGCYITCSSLKKDDIKRIIKFSLSPLYISVHATDDKTRNFMLQKKMKASIKDILKILTSNNIYLHTQIVVCPKINDNKILEKTILDLVEFIPFIKSIAVVPVGLTKHRKGLHTITPFDKTKCVNIIKQTKKLQKYIKNKFNKNILYLSDEFYIKADKKIPSFKHYNDFPQYDNGVGMLRDFIHYFNLFLKRKLKIQNKENVMVITGISAYKYIQDLFSKLEIRTKRLYKVVPVKNIVFGECITVTGLLTGKDIINTINKNKSKYKKIIIPPNCLNHENKTLDDLDLDKISNTTQTRVYTINKLDDLLS